MRSFGRATLGLLFIATAGYPGPATAQSVPPPPESAGCELHVWPSSGLRSIYHGWFHGGIVDGAVTGRQGYPPVPRDPLPSSLQIELLQKTDVSGILGLKDYQIVWHDEPLDSRSIRATPGRLTDSAAGCYAELVSDDVFFQQDVFSGTYLKSLTRFRSFGPGQTATRTFSTWTQTKLTVFPPKEDSQNEAALAELRGAFTNNLNAFGAFLNKPPKKKR